MAAADVSQIVPLLEDRFHINGKPFTVTLTSAVLKWHPVNGTSADEVAISIEEILSANYPDDSFKDDSPKDDSSLQLAYIKHKKGHSLGREEVRLEGKCDVCTKWCQTIQECLNKVSGRPKNALVLINPISGNTKGPQLYEQKVAPVFRETSIQTQVILTESADHVKEIIDKHDLTSIDSLIIVGGDGMYHLVANALLRRLARDAGLDLDDPENDIREIQLPIGIIPCGTGNGIATSCYGCVDVDTAALAIARGCRQKLNVFGVWSAGEFLQFSIMCQGLGVLADIMYDTEKWRSWGKWRYPIVFGKYMLLKGSVRIMDVSVETRAPATLPTQINDNAAEDKHQQNTELQQPGTYSQPWKSHTGKHVLIGAFLADYSGVKETGNPGHLNFSRLFMMKEWGRMHMHRFFPCLITYSPACMHLDNVDHEPFVEYKITLNNPEEQDGHANLLNIDGEMFHLKQPNVHVKLFPCKMNLFASTSMERLLLP